MLEHLRLRAQQALSSVHTATLASCGPAGIQMEEVPCRLQGLRLYVWVPRVSDQLLNLENSQPVLIVGGNWKLRGTARLLLPEEAPVQRAEPPTAAWSACVEILPVRLHLAAPDGNSFETIDF